jgi:hypothetical protein
MLVSGFSRAESGIAEFALQVLGLLLLPWGEGVRGVYLHTGALKLILVWIASDLK